MTIIVVGLPDAFGLATLGIFGTTDRNAGAEITDIANHGTFMGDLTFASDAPVLIGIKTSIDTFVSETRTQRTLKQKTKVVDPFGTKTKVR